MKVVIITGSRGWTDKEKIRERILFHAPDLVVQGGAGGADRIAADVCDEEGIKCEPRKANWARFKGVAGFVRNGEMLDEFPEATVEAFWDGRSPGTKDCIDSALFRNMTVEVNK